MSGFLGSSGDRRRRAPAVPVAVCFVLGVAFGPAEPPWLAWFGVPLVFLTGVVLAGREKTRAATGFVLVGFFMLGGACRRVAVRDIRNQPLTDFFDELDLAARELPTLAEGRLVREPETGLEKSVLLLEVDRILFRERERVCRGGLRANVYGDRALRSELTRLYAGDRVRLWIVLRRPKSYRNPGGFDFESHLNRRGMTLTGSVKSALLVERIGSGWSWQSLFSRVRSLARNRLARVYRRVGLANDETPGVVLALVIGDRSILPPWAERLYQKAGTFHVIAISGAHVGLIALLLYGCARRIGIDRTPALLILLIALPLYAALCGGRPPVVRAVIMSAAVVGTRLLSLDSPSINGLALSAVLLLAYRPLDLHDAGFQLSFVATASILVLYHPVASVLVPRLGRLGTWMAVSLAAQAGVVPVLAWHFGRFVPAAIAANLVTMPLAGALIVSGGVLVLVAPVPGLGEVLAWATWVLVKGMTVSSQWAISVPGGSMAVPTPGVSWLVLYFATLVAVLLSRGGWRKGMAAAYALVVLWLVFRPSPPTCPFELRLTAFDVGHGDAVLLELPGGERILVDGGGSFAPDFDVGESVVVPALLRRGIRSLDVVVMTHPDQDHIGGLTAVLSNLRVKTIWEGTPAWSREAYRDVRAIARGIPFKRLATGDRIRMGEVGFDVLHGARGVAGGESVGNEDSLVLHIVYGRARVLLTGDVGEEVELDLLRSGRLPRIDVLKVGHHGSRSSTTPPFLEATTPRVAVVSTGASGFLPIPSPRVLVRLRKRGITSLRTDRDGAITVRLDRRGNLTVDTFRSSGR